MSLLALDLGTKTGYAFGAPGCIVSGTEDFKANKFAGGGMRFLQFRRWLDRFKEAPGLTEVVYEGVRAHAGVDAAHVYGGFMATLTQWCEVQNIPYQGVPVGTIKKYWTGNGNAKKEQMIAAAEALGFKPKDDNEADAIALFFYQTTANGG